MNFQLSAKIVGQIKILLLITGGVCVDPGYKCHMLTNEFQEINIMPSKFFLLSYLCVPELTVLLISVKLH